MAEQASRILIVGPSWVGDMVMAQSLFRVLHQAAPDTRIDVLAPAWSRPIIDAMPEVRQAIDMPVGHGSLQWGTRKALAAQLQGQYDQAIVLPNSLKSALIPWMARIPRRTGWRGEMRYGLLNDLRKLDKNRYPLMVQRFCALALPEKSGPMPQAEIPPPRLVVDPALVEQALRERCLRHHPEQPILALCPGAEFGIAKKWPEIHYAQVARAHLEQGGQVWLFGSANDRASCELIHSELHHANAVSNLAGETSLQEAVALLSLASSVVSNDSGLMHVAAALSRPVVAVYGSTSPGFTPPLGEAVATVRTGIECSPCFQRECPYGHYRCLRELSPERVKDALIRVTAPVEPIVRHTPSGRASE